ncbi:hypothetical protein [Bacillus velezensis]|uniref:hypothetical protein n=1 Tax=Bacillus velezensis TaxID=492670 RepID=UPI0002531FEF|nr:hypothetical protein [Bacillus velezensis]UYV24323.1 hypothetical protein K9864_07670 [Bacillus velezensis]WDW01684.1 hypothetical protein PWA59_07740 [Bacillus velezensis]WMX42115.1 hypothetical protein RGQ10_03480 [Bacillus velezensis]CCG49448.1 SPBc2 prophage-derived uncharacterized protein yomR [Bacillus velezensis YAU B9601-Y2]
MSNSQFVGQLKQNNIQINNLKDQFYRTEAHMSAHENRLSEKVDDFMEKQNFDLKMHTLNTENPHHVTKEQVGLSNLINEEQATKEDFNIHLNDKKNPHAVTKSQVGLSKVDNIQQAAKTDFDAHLEDKDNPHGVTKAQIGLSAVTNDVQAKKADFDKHTSDTSNPHNVTALQIGLGNVENIQQAAKSDFDDHLNDTNVHISKSDRDRWDAAQLSKITKDNGSVLINVSQGVDFQSVAIGQRKTFTFYTAETGINTPPVPTRGMYLYSSSSYGEAIAFGNDGSLWRKSLSSGVWSDWVNYETEQGSIKRLAAHSDNTDIHVTKDDKDKWNSPWNATWNNVSLINGAQQYPNLPFQFSVANNRLELRGSFGSLPAAGTVVAKFAYKASALYDIGAQVVGSYGTARFAYTPDGELRFDGMSVSNSSARVSFNASIPLW